MKAEFTPTERFVYHITLHETWEAAPKTGFLTEPSLTKEGFIHFSTQDQVARTANKFYHGMLGLVLLEIDCQKLPEKMIYEQVEPGSWFPHYYAPLPVNSVSAVTDFLPGSDGSFSWPGNELD